MKTNRMLMSVAALTLLAASPALAEGANADTNTQIKTPVGSVSNSISGSAATDAPVAAAKAQATVTMSEFDTNGDGAISKDEYASTASQGADIQQFAQLDVNRDGKLSSAELKANAKVRSMNQ